MNRIILWLNILKVFIRLIAFANFDKINVAASFLLLLIVLHYLFNHLSSLISTLVTIFKVLIGKDLCWVHVDLIDPVILVFLFLWLLVTYLKLSSVIVMVSWIGFKNGLFVRWWGIGGKLRLTNVTLRIKWIVSIRSYSKLYHII